MSRFRRFALSSVLALGLAVPIAGAVITSGRPAAAATSLPAGFSEQVVFAGLVHPTKVVFSPDGRVFVAEKSGVIKVFDSLSSTTAHVFADLSAEVHDYEDEGLLGLALPPNFPTSPYVYVAYTYDALIGGTPPTYGDACPTTATGCPVSGRISRLQASGNAMVGTEQVLINDWCTQFETHSMGDLAFGADGALYASGGDGGSASFADWGQAGNPVNPCGDPPGGVGGAMNPPSAEGGALRSQRGVRDTSNAAPLNGTIIRIDPATGAAMPDNPLYNTTTDANRRRIVAYGLRNPYRWTFRPGTSEIWIGDVGWRNWEEIDRLVNPLATPLTNFGWPCYEGVGQQPGYKNANLSLCNSLYTAGTATPPVYQYAHVDHVVSGDACPTGGSSPTGVAFYPTSGGTYPSQYAGALFWADYSRQCIYAMLPGAGGVPDPANIVTFAPGAATPVDLVIGPGNDLYYADINGGTIRRIRYSAANQPPTAAISADVTSGGPPLAVTFSSAGSTDPNPGDVLTYQWDFTNDGTFDATGATASFTYTTAGVYAARLRVTDAGGLFDEKTLQILVGVSAPTPVIDTPSSSLTWATGDNITFTGHATDQQDGTLPASALKWDLTLQHCTTGGTCHQHFLIQSQAGASGTFQAPDHDYPSYLTLTLTATNSRNLNSSTTISLYPATSVMTFGTSPSGLQLTVGSTSAVTPFSRTVIQKSSQSVAAPTPQTVNGSSYAFTAWSDGGAAAHVIPAPTTNASYTATYTQTGGGVCSDSYGYVCSTTARAFTPADTTVLPLAGDDATTQVSLPFQIRLYGQSYSTAWVDTNGVVSMVNPNGYHAANGNLPTAALPNAAVYPFWADLVVDGSASVRTTTTGTAPNRQFVIEWRNVYIYGNTSRRLTFEAILSETGDVITNYTNLDNDFERGSVATVGIENADGSVGLPYSVNTPKLQSGTAVVFTAPGGAPPPPPPPPTTGSISGTVSVSGGGAVSGATVTLNPGNLSTTTSGTGTYSFTGLADGTYTVAATYNGQSASASVTVSNGGAATANLTVPAAPPPRRRPRRPATTPCRRCRRRSCRPTTPRCR
ncbi:PQQ-dependent sugar dehydrogenase [Dactylosporangium cerinum]